MGIDDSEPAELCNVASVARISLRSIRATAYANGALVLTSNAQVAGEPQHPVLFGQPRSSLLIAPVVCYALARPVETD